MSVNVGCPHCGRKLRIEDEFIGRKVRCPDCKNVFVGEVPASSEDAEGITTSQGSQPARQPEDEEPAPQIDSDAFEEVVEKKKKRRSVRDDEDEDDADRDTEGPKKPKRLKASEARPGWRAMRLSLSLFIWSVNTILTVTAIFFLGFLLLMLLTLIAAKARTGGLLGVVGVLFIILYVIYAFGALASFIMSAIGHGFLWQVPNKPGSGLRPMGIATMSLFYGYFVMLCAGMGGACVLGYIDGRLGFPVYACSGGLGFFMGLAWFFVFWIFMRLICLEARNTEAARAPIYFMIVYPSFVIGAPIVLFLIVLLVGATAAAGSYSPNSAMHAGGAAFVVIVLCYLVFLIVLWCLWLWASFILQEVRKCVEGMMRR